MYDHNEDRIKVNAQLPDNEAITLWFTQRMLKMVVTHLLKWLDMRAPAASEGVSTNFSKGNYQRRSTKAAPSKDTTSEKPVVPAGKSGGSVAAGGMDAPAVEKPLEPVLETGLSVLVVSVDLSSNERIIRLAFKSEKSAPPFARLTLKPDSLRSWLKIVQSQWRKASWPDEVWPASVEPADMEMPSKEHVTLH